MHRLTITPENVKTDHGPFNENNCSFLQKKIQEFSHGIAILEEK